MMTCGVRMMLSKKIHVLESGWNGARTSPTREIMHDTTGTQPQERKDRRTKVKVQGHRNVRWGHQMKPCGLGVTIYVIETLSRGLIICYGLDKKQERDPRPTHCM